MSPMKVSIFLAVGICLFAINVYAEGAAENEDDENTIKVYKRLIPADVLRGLYRTSSMFRFSNPFPNFLIIYFSIGTLIGSNRIIHSQ